MYSFVSSIAKRWFYYTIILVIAVFILPACNQRPEEINFISGIQDVLPNGWEMEVIDQKGAMGHPHGLDEPLFRIDFIDRTHQFRDEGGRTIFPSARLYFYDIRETDTVLETIKLERVYSWDVPDYFDQTAQYIIVTSPLYINGGYYSEEAVALYEPLERALKEYFKLYR